MVEKQEKERRRQNIVIKDAKIDKGDLKKATEEYTYNRATEIKNRHKNHTKLQERKDSI